MEMPRVATFEEAEAAPRKGIREMLDELREMDP
jgi:hypothetical protein